MISIFFIGVLEMVIITAWTKIVSDSKVLASGVVTFVNVFIWYLVLQTVLANFNNFGVVGFYAAGCAVGTMLCTAYFRRKELAAEEPSLGLIHPIHKQTTSLVSE